MVDQWTRRSTPSWADCISRSTPWARHCCPKAVLGNPNWPWRPISEADARSVIERIQERGPGIVALSGHDSTPWTIHAFGRAFGERYRTLLVGEEIQITA